MTEIKEKKKPRARKNPEKKDVISQANLEFRLLSLDCFHRELNLKNDRLVSTEVSLKEKESELSRKEFDFNSRSRELAVGISELKGQKQDYEQYRLGLEKRAEDVAELEKSLRAEAKSFQAEKREFIEKAAIEKPHGIRLEEAIREEEAKRLAAAECPSAVPGYRQPLPAPTASSSKEPDLYRLNLASGIALDLPANLKTNEYKKIAFIFNAFDRALSAGMLPARFWFDATVNPKAPDQLPQSNGQEFLDRIFRMAAQGEDMIFLFAIAKQIEEMEANFVN